MGKRSNPALHLNNSPLALVLTQVKFPSFLNMEKRVPDIQEALRNSGLVRFTKEQTQQLVFGPEIKQSNSVRWVFADRNRKEAIVLANNFAVFEVSSYSTFDEYLGRMLELLNPIREFANLDYIEQIGIRYVDVLCDTDDLAIENMICESLRGLSAESLGMSDSNYQFAIQGGTPFGTLVVRSFEGNGPQFMPPDLQTEHLSFDTKIEIDTRFRVVDFDHICKGDVNFEDKELSDKLWEMHDHTDIAFRKIVTERAIAFWEGK